MIGAHKDSIYQNYSGSKIVTANGEKSNIIGARDLHLSAAMPLTLSNVFMVLNLTAKLISVRQLVDEGCKLTFL